jgi:hypothetical protein
VPFLYTTKQGVNTMGIIGAATFVSLWAMAGTAMIIGLHND